MAEFQMRMNELYEAARDRNYKIGREEFAKQCGITLGQLNGYLIGQGNKFCETLKTIASNEKVSVSWLVGETDAMLEEGEILRGLSVCEVEKVKEFVRYLKFMREKENDSSSCK